MDSLAALGGMFLAGVAEATFLPVRSEIVLVGLLYADRAAWPVLLAVAALGNTLGATVNWTMGFFIARFEGRRWYPFRREQIARAERWYHRWGRWSLLLSWVPVIGDLLTVAAGLLREPLPVFLLIVGLAKTVRYLVVIALAFQWL
jgi:membrane protein YqaA with SNARE-associated domain